MKKVVAKFTCDKIEQNEEFDYNTVILSPVYSGSKENETFFNLTPAGKIEMGTVNKEALKQFVVGKEYYVTFEASE